MSAVQRDPETHAALVAREVLKAPQRFDAEPSTPSCFAHLSGADGKGVQTPDGETERDDDKSLELDDDATPGPLFDYPGDFKDRGIFRSTR